MLQYLAFKLKPRVKFYLAPISLISKEPPDELSTVRTKCGLVEERADERVAIMIVDFLVDCFISRHLGVERILLRQESEDQLFVTNTLFRTSS